MNAEKRFANSGTVPLVREAASPQPAQLHAYLTTFQAAAVLGVSPRTLERLRLVGGGPKWAKAGRACRYRRDWLDHWLEARVFTCTKESRAQGII
jgi:excisionase family DNA binding protein